MADARPNEDTRRWGSSLHEARTIGKSVRRGTLVAIQLDQLKGFPRNRLALLRSEIAGHD